MLNRVSHLTHRRAQSHPCRFESRCCPQTACPFWSAYTPRTPFWEGKTKQNNKQHLLGPLLFTSVDTGRDGPVRRLTSSWCRRPGRWDTCHTWPHKHQAGCTRRPRTHTGPCRCTTSPGWTCRCQCVSSSCSSRPASLAHTDRSHSYRRHGLEDKKRHRLTHFFFSFLTSVYVWWWGQHNVQERKQGCGWIWESGRKEWLAVDMTSAVVHHLF